MLQYVLLGGAAVLVLLAIAAVVVLLIRRSKSAPAPQHNQPTTPVFLPSDEKTQQLDDSPSTDPFCTAILCSGEAANFEVEYEITFSHSNEIIT